MGARHSQRAYKVSRAFPVRRLYARLAARPHTVIMGMAIFYTLAVKLFHCLRWRYSVLGEYFGWVLADVATLLGIEVILALICFRWPRRWVLRVTAIIAAIVCTWSVMNAGWLIRTGTQILPTSLKPLFHGALNSLGIVAVNLKENLPAAAVLLVPSVFALAFFFSVLAKPRPPDYNRVRFVNRIVICIVVVLVATLLRGTVGRRGSPEIASVGLRYNSQLRAITSLLLPGSGRLVRADFVNAKRTIPSFDDPRVSLPLSAQRTNHNVLVIVLEGIQYQYTSLAGRAGDLTPHLASLARQGVEFTNVRSTLTHTTKALFAFFTGRYPSVSHDIAEAVPAPKPYASLATILRDRLNFRTAFFQSAKGNFESRPGLVSNLGFDTFWARDYLADANGFLGYLGCDEFAMIKPIAEWVSAEEKPFFLTVLCSASHDPYDVPRWFAEPAREPVERYRQVIAYTDKFVQALDDELAKMNLADRTILCVIADHGEAFGEHGLLGHELIAFDEVLRVPWVMRAPSLVEPATKVTETVSSVDLAPTILALLGFDTSGGDFDGLNALGRMPQGRRVYFSGWMQQSPAGYVQGNRKFVYNPMDEMVSVYDLAIDPLELVRLELPEQEAGGIAQDVVAWRRNSIFRIGQQRTGQKTLFDSWLCRWSDRVSTAKYWNK